MRFLALGDSYTIGHDVGEAERWPVQLQAQLVERGLSLAPPEIIAVTGWTTDELAAGMEQVAPQRPYALVSLLIGVNNQYRGYAIDSYRQEFAQLLGQAIALAGDEPGRVIVLSIPDWGVTPFAAERDADQIGAEIDQFNQINRQEAARLGALYIDITAVSRRAKQDPSLIASDGLHPSGKMYGLWVKLMLPTVLAILQGK